LDCSSSVEEAPSAPDLGPSRGGHAGNWDSPHRSGPPGGRWRPPRPRRSGTGWRPRSPAHGPARWGVGGGRGGQEEARARNWPVIRVLTVMVLSLWAKDTLAEAETWLPPSILSAGTTVNEGMFRRVLVARGGGRPGGRGGLGKSWFCECGSGGGERAFGGAQSPKPLGQRGGFLRHQLAVGRIRWGGKCRETPCSPPVAPASRAPGASAQYCSWRRSASSWAQGHRPAPGR
jgi:hypothetical protein